MTDITALQEAVLALPDDDYARFRQWFSELDWEKWDRRIEEDSAEGKLDHLIAEAFEAKEKGTLREL
ncbi:MAG: hypothetical protein OXH73_17375 [Caldilineaceae bacterium]|nr:hypothetical protein [Caldilineaceae bacterium]